MADLSGAPGGAPDPQADQPTPRMTIVSQYIKDLSFENPRPLGLHPRGSARPNIAVRVDVAAGDVGRERYEVTLSVHVEAKTEEETDFVAELSYGGLFEISGVPPEALQAILMIEGPRLLFPFARRIVADVTRDGGLPPLMIDPIDFAALFRHRLEQQRRQMRQAASAAPPDAGPN